MGSESKSFLGSLSGLSDNEWKMLKLVFRAPPLWGLLREAADFGWDEALDRCRRGESGLPPYSDMQHLIDGVRLRANRKPKEPIRDAAERIGVPFEAARKGLAVLQKYASLPERAEHSYDGKMSGGWE